MSPAWGLLLLGAYLLGSVSFSLLVVRGLRRVDLRTVGSGNAGATNVLRTSGGWPALLVLALDIAKGAAPVQLARRLEAPSPVVAGAALAAVVGHVFPLFFGFRGGKGVATGFGALLSLFPLAGAAALVLFVVAVAASRLVSLGSLLAATALPVLAWALGRWQWSDPNDAATLALASCCSAIVVVRHRANLRRIAAGTERRLGENGER